jgi:hypothetical protein
VRICYGSKKDGRKKQGEQTQRNRQLLSARSEDALQAINAPFSYYLAMPAAAS